MKVTIYTKEKGIIETTYPLSDEIQDLTWHRTDGPAYVGYHDNGTISWEQYWAEGKRHRTDGPVDIRYYDNGQLEWEQYWVNGKRHRTDGPADIVYHDNGTICWDEYWINGIEITDQTVLWLKQNNITYPFTDKEQYEFIMRFS